ncbi:metal ABC transporter substrate-binding protein [Cyanobium sp. FGCU-52]|nr:metal ABC transporter substrate-binding protein [Cyanobium sp. FGCU52]
MPRGPISGLLLVLLLLTACGRAPDAARRESGTPPPPGGAPQVPPGRPKVLASFTVVADMAREVACGQLQVESITRPGAEIHGYEITPSDLRRARGADLLLENGLGLDRWTHRFTAGLGNVPRVVVSKGVATLPIVGGSHPDAVNPHAWMSPKAALTYVANIRDAFIRLDPPRAATYRRCAAAYADRIRALDRDLATRLARLSPQHRMLVSCEGAFSYLTRDYGLDEAWLWPVNSEREVTPQRMERLIATVRRRRVPAVFCESTVDARAQQRVARESGSRFGGIFYVDSLSLPGGPAPTYIDLMRRNVDTLVRGLQGTDAPGGTPPS